MTTTEDLQYPSGRAGLHDGRTRRSTAIARLSIGLIQGVVLWWLHRASDGGGASFGWPADNPALYAALTLVFAYVPVVLLAGVGRLRPVTLAIWSAVATAVLALLAWHDIDRRIAEDTGVIISPALIAFAATALFIGHHLVLPADRARRWIAPFPAYFDAAWMAGVQLALSLLFTGAFWLLLTLGAELFHIIGLNFLRELTRDDWFAFPVTTLVFAVAVQLTDVRDGLIRGVRTVALMLLSWLLLVLTVLVAGFLAALPFTGLDGLWNTGSATALVLSAAAGLIVLINTAYQDGRPDNLPPAALRIAVRVASVLLTPLIAIAFWGLALRIGQHGLTPDRIIAVACALVGAGYAIGYGAAALIPLVRKRPWMKALEPTNIATALLEVAVILILFSPLADPARLSVADQTARLTRGAVAPDAFDYAFLRFHSGRAGEAALADLARSPTPEIAQRAKKAQLLENRYDVDLRTPADLQIQPWPDGTVLPPAFLTTLDTSEFGRGCEVAGECVATQRDLNGDGAPEILLANPASVTLFARAADGRWVREGDYRLRGCPRGDAGQPDARELLKSGGLAPRPAEWPEMLAGDGFVSQLNPAGNCDRLPVNP